MTQLVRVTTSVSLITAAVCVFQMLKAGLVTDVRKDIGASLVVENVSVTIWPTPVTTLVDIVLVVEISHLAHTVTGNSFFHIKSFIFLM